MDKNNHVYRAKIDEQEKWYNAGYDDAVNSQHCYSCKKFIPVGYPVLCNPCVQRDKDKVVDQLRLECEHRLDPMYSRDEFKNLHFYCAKCGVEIDPNTEQEI